MELWSFTNRFPVRLHLMSAMSLCPVYLVVHVLEVFRYFFFVYPNFSGVLSLFQECSDQYFLHLVICSSLFLDKRLKIKSPQLSTETAARKIQISSMFPIWEVLLSSIYQLIWKITQLQKNDFFGNIQSFGCLNFIEHKT